MVRSLSRRIARMAFLGLVAGTLCQATGCSGSGPHPFPQWNEGPKMSDGLDVYGGTVEVKTVAGLG